MTTRLPVIIFALFCALVIPETVQAQRGSYAAVAAGEYHGLVLKEDSSLYGWDMNEEGQIGNGSKQTARTPTRVEGGVKEVACGREFTIYITNAGDFKSVGKVYWR